MFIDQGIELFITYTLTDNMMLNHLISVTAAHFFNDMGFVRHLGLRKFGTKEGSEAMWFTILSFCFHWLKNFY